MNFVKNCIYLVVLISICTSCEKELIDHGPDQEEQIILDYLEGLDYNMESVEFKDDFVLYESDAGWSKADLLASIKKGEEFPDLNDPDADDFIGASERQQALENVNSIITRQNVANISYYIRGSVSSDLNSLWRDAVVDAAEVWTNLSNCRINMTRTYSSASADIVIGSDNDQFFSSSYLDLTDGEVVAVGTYPVNGSPGRYITINDYYVNMAFKVQAMVHEFGHCLGFMHTDVDEGIQIHGTHQTDNNSVMNTSVNPVGIPLRAGDKRMARIIYPNSLVRPSGFTATRSASGRVRIVYINPSYGTKPYYWVRVAKYSTSGQILATRYFHSGNYFPTGYHILDWGGHQPGTYRFAIRGCNYKKDVWSHRSPQVTVTL